MSIKNKLRTGISFLFLMALITSGLAAYYLNRLSADSSSILKDNYRSLIYSKAIGQVLDSQNGPVLNNDQLQVIEKNVEAEENNITENGEHEMAASLRADFEAYNSSASDPQLAAINKAKIKTVLYQIMQVNMAAMELKDKTAAKTASNGVIIVSFIGSLCFLIAFTFILNFPGYIANPIRELTVGIKEIANKNYRKRIIFKSNDEFGDLAEAFNQMARKLDDYQNSSLANLLFEKKRIEAIINLMHDAIIGLDDKMFIIFSNKVACTLMGIDEQKLIGKYAPDVALENDLLRNMLHSERSKLKIYADNNEGYFLKEEVDVVNEDNTIGKVIILKNITEFQKLDEAKTNFIATISHELKTPISSIKLSLKLLEDQRVGTMNQEQHHLVKNIDEETQRLLKITGELLDMAQVETGKINLNIRNTAVKTILEYAVNAVKFIADQKMVTIQVECPDLLPPIQTDPDKTTWVLINLLNNAIKYSTSRSVINLTVTKFKDGVLKFSVKDHGQGIETRYISRIFERYFKIPDAGTEETGTGLGLAIAKEFIEAQGGTIAVESEPGEGSDFYFTLKTA